MLAIHIVEVRAVLDVAENKVGNKKESVLLVPNDRVYNRRNLRRRRGASAANCEEKPHFPNAVVSSRAVFLRMHDC